MGELPAGIRAELDQTPAWWQAQFDTLVRNLLPRHPAAPAGHDIDEPIRSWNGSVLAREWCTTCHVPIGWPLDG